MKNFVFISPNFPDSYWKFCAELKKNGLRVLGVGDCPYDQLKQELRDSLEDYFKVDSLMDYESVFRAVAFLTYKWGKIDYLESNNEFWLERDAALRTAFHITTGFQESDMEKIKLKSAMKAYYEKAGLPTARYHLVGDKDAALAFAAKVGYPVIVKPDNGVGASSTYKLRSDDELEFFFATKDPSVQFIMEEFVNGEVHTYDAIVDSKGNSLFEIGNVTVYSIMDVVNDNDNSLYYYEKILPEKMRKAGRATIEAFGVTSRFVHLEFFVLNDDQEGLGKKGDVLGLEVNMRPSGGYSPDMMNFARETDVYKIWADMIAYDSTLVDSTSHPHYCAFIGRRDGKDFVMSHDDLMAKYGHCAKMVGRIPDALAGAMANQMYICNFDTYEELQQFFKDGTQSR